MLQIKIRQRFIVYYYIIYGSFIITLLKEKKEVQCNEKANSNLYLQFPCRCFFLVIQSILVGERDKMATYGETTDAV